MNDTGTARWMQRGLAAGAILGLVISWPVWRNQRDFPLVPLIPPIPAPFDLLLPILLVAAFMAIAIPWKPKAAISVILCCVLLLGLQDQMRWQPWIYQYGLMLLPFLFLAHDQVLRTHRLIMAAVYGWSGTHKFGAGFQNFWEGYIVKDWPLMQPLSSTVPIIEIALALCLLFPRSQRIGAGLAIFMHLGLLVILGPLGHNINPVVWPWNLCMIAFCVLLFFRPDPVFTGRLPVPAWAILLLVYVMPIFTYTGHWPRYLGWHLYSGRSQRLLVFVHPHAIQKVTPYYQPQVREAENADGLYQLNFAKWSEQTLRVPMVSENRVYRTLIQQFLETPFTAGDVFVYRDYPNWLNEWGYISYPGVDFRTFKRLPPFEKKPLPEFP